LITGASRGIGHAIALRFAKEGALVAAHYGKNADAAAAVVREIEAAGGEAFAVQAELESLEQIRRMYHTLEAELTRRRGSAQFDILVNNAGVGVFAPIGNTTEEQFDRLIAVNLKGPFLVTQLAMSRLRDGGKIINMSSGGSQRASLTIPVYSMIKAALNAFTVQLAADLGRRGITVNTLAPGPTSTDASIPFLGDAEQQKTVAKMTVLGRVGKPTDIANVAAFLASDDSAWVTGQYIEASGGFRML
jgi:NAD(P)-dependent dehydrogenase (short-subunit alcohol dehydrogenase family)